MPLLRDGSDVEDVRLDRIYQPDPRNDEYPVRRLLTAVTAPRSYTWPMKTWLDQGQEGACVGFGFAHELAATPVPVANITNDIARTKLYFEIQRRDPWPGGAYPGAEPRYDGTSVLSGAKYVTSLGAYGAYHWAQTVDELALYVGWKGPAVLGLNWHQDMFKPDRDGFLHPTGPVMGGHCLIAIGVSVVNKYFILHNSWGPSWGHDGRAKVTFAEMATLLADDGEACCPDGRQLIAL